MRKDDVAAPPPIAPETAFRRAMIAASPDYFSWDRAAQERYRLGLTEEVRFRIAQELLKTLFGMSASTGEQMDAVFETFDDRHYLLYNSAMLFVQGIGDDLFFLNDYLGDGKTLADFETLGAYDYDDYCFQQEALKDECPERAALPYQGTLQGTWARLHIDGAFSYASLWMAAGYLGSVIDEAGQDKIAALIPHRHVRGKDDGKREGGGTLLDIRIDANGQEAQLEELKSRYYRYVGERQRAMAGAFDREERKRVYLLDESRGDDPHMNFIFTDKTALEDVRLCHFMADCRKLAEDRTVLDGLAEQEKRAAMTFLEENFKDIRDNFDPSVVKFRKKRKIVLADGALDGLL
jgi:hypothetical protein